MDYCEVSVSATVDNHFTRQYNPEDNSEHCDSSVVDCSSIAPNPSLIV
jgi:hypothetical protein